jgi:CRISPR-associated endonuclease Csn1
MAKTLGLDIGANSIGWFIIDDVVSAPVLACGVRVFPEGVDNFDTKKEKPKMEARRVARGMRRQIARRSARKQQLRRLFASAGLVPQSADEQRGFNQIDPYTLRSKARSEALAKGLQDHEWPRRALAILRLLLQSTACGCRASLRNT